LRRRHRLLGLLLHLRLYLYFHLQILAQTYLRRLRLMTLYFQNRRLNHQLLHYLKYHRQHRRQLQLLLKK
jgi:hypothetical protein